MVRTSRRLPHTLLAAIHQACDTGQFDLAAELLRLGEEVIASDADARRRRHDMGALVAAHERLWLLRHGEVWREPE
jgi:hypothetical protein